MFKKGVSGNPQGRHTGAKDKKSEKLREWLLEMVEERRGTIAEDLAAVDPATRLSFLTKILPYVLPRLNAVEVQDGEDKRAVFLWKEVDAEAEPIMIVHKRAGIPSVSSEDEVLERERYYLNEKNYQALTRLAINNGVAIIKCDSELERDTIERIAEQE